MIGSVLKLRSGNELVRRLILPQIMRHCLEVNIRLLTTGEQEIDFLIGGKCFKIRIQKWTSEE